MLTFDSWNPHPQTVREMEDNRARWNNEQYEQFMRENADDLEWFYVCSKFCLYENFIREMKDYIHWDSVFEFQIYHLNKDFIQELIDNYDEFGIFISGMDDESTKKYIKRRLCETHQVTS